jgi:hypothetical protein
VFRDIFPSSSSASSSSSSHNFFWAAANSKKPQNNNFAVLRKYENFLAVKDLLLQQMINGLLPATSMQY